MPNFVEICGKKI